MKIVATTTRHRDAAAPSFEKYVSAATLENDVYNTARTYYTWVAAHIYRSSGKASRKKLETTYEALGKIALHKRAVLRSDANNGFRAPLRSRTMFKHFGIHDHLVATVIYIRLFINLGASSPRRMKDETIKRLI